jgi:hypothetical protein
MLATKLFLDFQEIRYCSSFVKNLSNERECSDTRLTDGRTLLQGVNEFLPYRLCFWPVSMKFGYKHSAHNTGEHFEFRGSLPSEGRTFIVGVNEIRCALVRCDMLRVESVPVKWVCTTCSVLGCCVQVAAARRRQSRAVQRPRSCSLKTEVFSAPSAIM